MSAQSSVPFFTPSVLSRPSFVVNGSISGLASFSQVQEENKPMKLIVYCNALVGTASYTFPTPFADIPTVLASIGSKKAIISSISTTSITITGESANGFIFLQAS